MFRKRLNWKILIAFLALALVLAACSQEEDPTATPAAPEPTVAPEVEPEATAASGETEPAGDVPEISQPIYLWGEVADRVWVLVGFGDAANPTVVEEGIFITASFSSSEGQVGGTAGCNNYFTAYESTDDGGLTISGPIGVTMMACEDGMEEEATYLGALETVTGWTLTEEGRLELAYDSGQPYDEKLVYSEGETPLTGPIWQLVSFGDPDSLQSLLSGTTITAEFAPETDATGTVGGNASCNNYTTSYTVDGDQITFGPIGTTRMMCPVGADQETAYLGALETAQTYEIVGPNMQIAYDGGVLNYTSLSLPLENVLWQALVLNGQPIPPEVEITALFNPGEEAGTGTVGGSAVCNSYNTSYETDADTGALNISSPMAMTMAMCPDETLASLESSYMAALETAESYDILGDQMVIHTGSGDIIYTADREPLLGTLWSLISIGDYDDPQPPVEGSSFTAQFSRLPTLPSGTVVGQTGCNVYNATFTANLNEIKINLPSKTNNEECPWGAGNFEVEQQFFLGLNSATEYRILGHVLQIPYGEGETRQVMNFEATEPPTETVIDLTPLDNTFWYLASFNGNPLVPGTEITAGFNVNEDDVTGQISGSGGCNAYNATIGENFGIGPVASTRKACAQPVMEQEGGYFDWLSNAYDYDRAGDQLLISTAHGVLVYNSTPVLDQSLDLQNRTWYLVSVGTLQAVTGSNSTALFAADGSSLSGATGCNDFNGSYKTEPGNKLTISGLTTTRAACTTEALAKQEEALLIFLPSAVGYTVSDTSMQIQTVDGSVINYTSIPPAQPLGPTAVISGPAQADMGELLTYDGSGSTAGSTPVVSYVWDMGDGTVLSGAIVSYSYSAAGAFTVQLTVTDQAGLSSTASQSVQVRPVVEVVPPTAVIEGPSAAFVGESVTFSAANSQPGTGTISTYNWQSGDGNNTGNVPDSTFTTIYSVPGVYYPTVTVIDANNLSDSASMAITVNGNLEGSDWILAGTLEGTSISIQFANGTLSGFAGCNSYNGTYTTPSPGTIAVGPINSSQALCSEEIMAQEQTYLSSLGTASAYTISGSTLTMTTASGQLIFNASMATIQPVPAPVGN